MYNGVYSDDPAEDELAIEHWGRFDAISERFAGTAETGDDWQPSDEDIADMCKETGLASCTRCKRFLNNCRCDVPQPARDDIPF